MRSSLTKKYVFLAFTAGFVFFTTQLLSAENGSKPLPPIIELTLKGTIDRAVENSHTVRQAREDLSAAQGRIKQATAKFYPTIQAEANAGTFHDKQPAPSETPPPEVERDRNQYDAKVTLTQNVFSGFSHWAGVQSAKADQESFQKKLDRTTSEVRFEIAKLYFEIQLKLRELAAEREVSELRQKQLEQVKARFAAGRATQVERLKAEYAVKSQIPQIKSLESDLEKDTLRLVQYVGLPLTQEFKLTDSLEKAANAVMSKPLPEIATAFDLALTSNPDLIGIESDLAKLSSDVKVTSAKNLPALDLIFSSGTNAGRRDEIGAPGFRAYGGQLKLSVPVFSGLSSFAERHENQAKINSMIEKKAATREKLLEDLRRVYSAWSLETVRMDAEKTNIELAEKTVIQAETLYQTGRATLTDVLDGYSNQLQAKKNLASAMYGRVAALAEIKFLLGQ